MFIIGWSVALKGENGGETRFGMEKSLAWMQEEKQRGKYPSKVHLLYLEADLPNTLEEIGF